MGRQVVQPSDAIPVFFGHYWLEDKYPVIQKDNVICLDYSVANSDPYNDFQKLVAYRFNGEVLLDIKHIDFVNSIVNK